MARLARVVILGHPHHVTQRGNGRAQTFFGDGDYALYRELLADHCRAAAVEVAVGTTLPVIRITFQENFIVSGRPGAE